MDSENILEESEYDEIFKVCRKVEKTPYDRIQCSNAQKSLKAGRFYRVEIEEIPLSPTAFPKRLGTLRAYIDLSYPS